VALIASVKHLVDRPGRILRIIARKRHQDTHPAHAAFRHRFSMLFDERDGGTHGLVEVSRSDGASTDHFPGPRLG